METAKRWSVYLTALDGGKSDIVAFHIFDEYPNDAQLEEFWNDTEEKGWKVTSLHVGKLVTKKEEK